MEEWQNPVYIELIKGHKLFVGFEYKTWMYEVQENKVIRDHIPELTCEH